MGNKRYRVSCDDDGNVTRIDITDKEPWKQDRGHTARRNGAGPHDTRPRKARTRAGQFKRAIESDD